MGMHAIISDVKNVESKANHCGSMSSINHLTSSPINISPTSFIPLLLKFFPLDHLKQDECLIIFL
jgi:hypothetical protein